jgi:hypothetical protein
MKEDDDGAVDHEEIGAIRRQAAEAGDAESKVRAERGVVGESKSKDGAGADADKDVGVEGGGWDDAGADADEDVGAGLGGAKVSCKAGAVRCTGDPFIPKALTSPSMISPSSMSALFLLPCLSSCSCSPSSYRATVRTGGGERYEPKGGTIQVPLFLSN